MFAHHADAALLKLARAQFNRKLVLWEHAVLACVSAFVDLSAMHLTHFYGGRHGGVIALILSFPVLVPYLLSAVVSYRIVDHDRIATWLFVTVLTCGAAMSWLVRLGLLGSVDGQPPPMLYLIIAQTFLYLVAVLIFFARFENQSSRRR